MITATETTTAARTLPRQQRLLALDQMRGLVMLLMTLDHASEVFNRGRFVTDAVWLWTPGKFIPSAQFLLRWATHLCAPTFVFLAGVGIALSTAKRRARGESEAALSRSLAGRGLFIAALDPLWMSPVMMEGQGLICQVMFAIGMSMLLLAALRHLPAKWLLAAGLALCLTTELGVLALGSGKPDLLPAMLLTSGMFEMQLGPLTSFVMGYPLLPWLAIMLLGYGCASWLAAEDRAGRTGRRVLFAGFASLAVFAVVRGLNDYGNMELLRDDAAPLQWLHVSKYPPSLSYVALELGCMGVLLSGFYAINRRYELQPLPRPLAALTMLGQAALFYYVLHLHLMAALGWIFGLHKAGEIGATFLGALVCVLLLGYPVARYQRYKAAHPNGWARFL